MVDIVLAVAACFICHQLLCVVVVLRTGSTRGLRDVAHATRALRKILSLRA